MRVIVHLSDIHFGRVDPATIEPLASAISRRSPHLLAVSGANAFNAGANTTIAFGANPTSSGNYRLMQFNGASPSLGNFTLELGHLASQSRSFL